MSPCGFVGNTSRSQESDSVGELSVACAHGVRAQGVESPVQNVEPGGSWWSRGLHTWTPHAPETNSAPTTSASRCAGDATATAATYCSCRCALRQLHKQSALTSCHVLTTQEGRRSANDDLLCSHLVRSATRVSHTMHDATLTAHRSLVLARAAATARSLTAGNASID